MIAQVVFLAALLALAHAGAIGLGLGGIGLGSGLGTGIGISEIGLSGGLGGGLRGLGGGLGGLGGGLGGLGGGLGGLGGGLGGLGGGISIGTKAVDLYAPPKYEYKYAVRDGHTGDLKEQVESRIGDLTKNEYATAEKDRLTTISRVIAGGKAIGLGVL